VRKVIEEQDHHYVPQFYLREWTAPNGRNEGKLLRYVLIKHTGKLHHDWVVPKGTAYDTNLYSAPSGVDFESWDPQMIETDVMSPIDNDAAKVLPKIIAAEALTTEDRRAWSRFLHSLVHRHKVLVEAKDEWAASVAEPMKKRWIEHARDEDARRRMEKAFAHCDVVTMARSIHRGEMVRTIDRAEALDQISKLAWTIINVDDGSLITTDRPLIIHMRGDQLMMTMALSPARILVAHQEMGTEEELDRVFRVLHAEHNSLLLAQGSDFVYSTRPIEGPLLERVERSLALPAEERAIEGRLPEVESEETSGRAVDLSTRDG
jgi:hypothetical protein